MFQSEQRIFEQGGKSAQILPFAAGLFLCRRRAGSHHEGEAARGGGEVQEGDRGHVRHHGQDQPLGCLAVHHSKSRRLERTSVLVKFNTSRRSL